ncbi:hypothetical protein NQ317_006064 [Molorchus minor]|uniref:Centrosomal protein of 135 kDa n=1 Tax=Molorchus minor TaxID=1323400 RepID=A0ABQ9K3N0_9CUCU|nr:hypothetical protein NQ317_006064 [Molorchus minor]
MESSYTKLRQELDDLGYIETLKPDCVPLVDRLLSDLKITTENLEKYMKLTQRALEERDNLRLGAEPYKCDNAKLIRECNELHLAFIQFKEQHEKVQKVIDKLVDLKVKIISLEHQLQNCESDKQVLRKRVKDLEAELTKTAKKGGRTNTLESKEKISAKPKGFQLDGAMACAEEKIARLSNEIRRLKEDHLQHVESNEYFKTQLQNRNEEIVRLKTLLEGGRPLEAITKDCCYKNIDNKMGSLQDEINLLKREKNSMANQLKRLDQYQQVKHPITLTAKYFFLEALAKQHEAMRRALHLAERNKQLEKEMKDIDQIALSVEAECNSTVRNNLEKVTRLQDRINESVIIIQNLERENSKVKQDKLELCSELDAVKLEKTRLQSLLDTEVEDKKRLTDRINSFTIIENDLNMEIDRLVRLTGEQRKKIAELECQVTEEKIKRSSFEAQRMPYDQTDYYFPHQAENFAQTENRSKSPTKSKKGNKTSKSKSTAKKGSQKTNIKKQSGVKTMPDIKTSDSGDKSPPLVTNYGPQMASRRCCCEAGSCVKHLRELLDREMEYRQAQAIQQIEALKQEKEYYMKEYHRLSDELRNVPTHDKPDKSPQQNDDLQRKIVDQQRRIEEKDRLIASLQEDVRNGREKSSKTSLRTMQAEEDDTICNKELNETTVVDQDRIKKAFKEMEEHIRKLEDERRELVVSQSSHRSNANQLEEENALLKEQLKAVQNDLNVSKASYAQLKNLHDQTDRSLSELQSKLLRSDTELSNLQSRMSLTHRGICQLRERNRQPEGGRGGHEVSAF